MPELCGMRAVVQFLRQSAEPCAAPSTSHGFADGSSGCQGTGSFPVQFIRLWLHPSCCSVRRPRILLTWDLANQIADLSRLPQLEPLFQLGVPVDTFRVLSQEQTTGPRTGDRSWLRRDFLPKPKRHAPWESHRGGSAKLGEWMLVPFCEDSVPSGSVWKRAVVKWLSWGHWLRALRKLLNGGRTAGRCTLMSGLSSVLKGTPDTKFTSGVLLLQKPHRLHRCDLMGPHTTQAARSRRSSCPKLSWSSGCPPCFRPLRCKRHPSVDALGTAGSGPHCAQRRFSLGCCFGLGGLLEFLFVDVRAAGAAGESEMRRS